jgi:hypothetical protein
MITAFYSIMAEFLALLLHIIKLILRLPDSPGFDGHASDHVE